jgi:ssDNA thymidine ADP-ribosyltransferase, DarT
MIMDARVTELHCIMPITNVASVMNRGILSHEQAAKLPHHSVAMQEIQDRRDQKSVPNGLRLHQYANLYFHARNPMLYKRRHEDVCVLTLSTGAFLIDKAVITDQNAASDYVRFLSPTQWRVLEFEDIFALDWRHPDDPYRYYRHKSRKCAEVLVPRSVPPNMIIGAYVPDDSARDRLRQTGFTLPIIVQPEFFFR